MKYREGVIAIALGLMTATGVQAGAPDPGSRAQILVNKCKSGDNKGQPCDPTLDQWDFDYGTEALGAPPTRERPAPTPFQPQPSGFVLLVDGQLAAQCRFTAELPDAVLIGGVYTPPALRNRGYGRGVVAGALVDARARGVTRGVLFTENPAARAAYAGIGFAVVGDYAIVLFSP